MPLGIPVDHDRLADICRRYHVVRLELFGSRARGEAQPESDIDLLVTFDEDYAPGLEFVALADELEQVFGRHVDLLTRRSIESDFNPYRRRSVLSTVEDLYAA